MSNSPKKVIDSVLKEIVPSSSEKERIEKLASSVLRKTNQESDKYGAHAIIAGSLTRDTWLTGKMEFDIFILFPKTMKKKDMEKAGLEIGKRVIKSMKGSYHIDYAEHPYVSGTINKIDIDIVPCYHLNSTSELKSSVDRTPFHVRYVERKLPKKLSNDVRLLKKFCGAHGLYGADTKTEGFSGYVCELLIINYGSFLKAMKAVSKWSYGEIIDIESFYKKSQYEHLKKKFRNHPLILIDPTDIERNTSAAVSPENYQKLKKLSTIFNKRPSRELFFSEKKKPLGIREFEKIVKSRGTDILLIRFGCPKVVPDILWPQLRKFSNRLESILKEYEFSVLRKGVYTDEKKIACVLLEMKNSALPYIEKKIGPHMSDEDGSKNFIDKYEKSAKTGPFIEDGFWVVETDRKFTEAEKKVKDSLDDPLKELKAKGIPSHIAEEISKKYYVFSKPKQMIQISKKDKEFGVFLREYFEKEKLVA